MKLDPICGVHCIYCKERKTFELKLDQFEASIVATALQVTVSHLSSNRQRLFQDKIGQTLSKKIYVYFKERKTFELKLDQFA